MLSRENWPSVVGVVLTAVLLLGTCTWYLSATINAVQRDDMETAASLAQRVTAIEQKEISTDQTISEHYADDTSFRSELRSTLATMVNQLADLKVAVAGKQPLRER